MIPKGTLCRIGKRNRLEKLRTCGEVFMATLDTFWSLEDGGIRGDPLDAVHSTDHGIHATLTRPDGTLIPVNITGWTFEERPREPQSINLFCMYAMLWTDGCLNIDPRVTKLGDTAIVFTNPDEFMNRIYDALSKTRRDFRGDLVTYVPDDYVGEIGPFRKRQRYSYQSEWRVACFDGPGSPLILSLGDLSGISTLMPSEKLEGSIQIGP